MPDATERDPIERAAVEPAAVERAEELRRSIGRFVRATRAAAADPLSEAQAATLALLEREGDATVAQLARRRGIRHQSARITVEELERSGYLERRPDPDDARSALIRPTDAGRLALATGRDARASTIAAAIDRECSAAERADLDRVVGVLDRLSASIEGE